jgi:hypothetical protein
MTYQIILKEQIPSECSCGNEATRKHTYLLEGNFRTNPRSSAYGKDDCTWCSDHEEFSCDACYAKNNACAPRVNGYGEASTFSKGERFRHMFIEYVERIVPVEVNIKLDGNMWHASFSDFINLQESPSGFGETKVKAVANLFREAVGIQQAITDPDNQPSQYGTIFLPRMNH